MLGRFAGLVGGIGGVARRAGIGAAVGGITGAINAPRGRRSTGFLAGAGLGAAGGAIVGGAGARMVQQRFGGVAGLAQTGLQRLTGAVGNLGTRAMRANNMTANRLAARTMRGLVTGRQFIGQNAASINKWGGRAMGALGAASAATLGTSILSSNNGYRR